MERMRFVCDRILSGDCLEDIEKQLKGVLYCQIFGQWKKNFEIGENEKIEIFKLDKEDTYLIRTNNPAKVPYSIIYDDLEGASVGDHERKREEDMLKYYKLKIKE